MPTSALVKMVPPVLLNTELQAVVVAGVCFVGVWVIVTKLIQLVFSILWPFLLLGTIYAVAPDFSQQVIMEVIPTYLQIFVEWTKATFPNLIMQRGGDFFPK